MERPGRQSVMKEMKAELTTERRWVKPPASAVVVVSAAMASLMSPKKRRSRTRCGMATGGEGDLGRWNPMARGGRRVEQTLAEQRRGTLAGGAA
ncbi:Os12g0133750 [Oryza sativa Japonica Group]|uniref:Os12g0133750 protein n=1 Tax=Oryza sativa subsp. japonica TaxID=39947 RepID=A0A0P0Y6V5_ORYSJ|nr:Os12g0133750 [Oryza sativa Japonica Group]